MMGKYLSRKLISKEIQLASPMCSQPPSLNVEIVRNITTRFSLFLVKDIWSGDFALASFCVERNFTVLSLQSKYLSLFPRQI